MGFRVSKRAATVAIDEGRVDHTTASAKAGAVLFLPGCGFLALIAFPFM
jgi:hypothetical protein